MKRGYEFLLDVLSRKNRSLNDLHEILGVTPQAIQAWKTEQRLPAKRVSQIAEYFSLNSQDIDMLLGNDPLRFEFRTKRGDHLSEVDVAEKVKVRAQVVYERFFSSRDVATNYNLEPLRNQIRTCNQDFFRIADCIRKEFTIPDYRPLLSDELYGLHDRVGTKSYFMPFRQIGLLNGASDDGVKDQSAILYSKNGCYTVLLDSDRTVDEAHFDRVHEFIHIIFDDLFPESNDLETLIDRVCGELIYPKKFIIEKFFNNDPSSKPATNKERLRSVFLDLTHGMRHILAPKGLARSMRDSDLVSRNSELFKFLHSEFHDEFRKELITYSKYGKMDFNFSDREKLAKFYEDVVEKTENASFYPLFVKIKEDLVKEIIKPTDFADTFNLKISDAIVLKAIWSKAQG